MNYFSSSYVSDTALYALQYISSIREQGLGFKLGRALLTSSARDGIWRDFIFRGKEINILK